MKAAQISQLAHSATANATIEVARSSMKMTGMTSRAAIRIGTSNRRRTTSARGPSTTAEVLPVTGSER
ncbi:MAG: hypothetical protein H0T94_11520 [Acidimicrobiia bacterium]|nr:hypothetical protein [Acidimicrobiia bacterium]